MNKDIPLPCSDTERERRACMKPLKTLCVAFCCLFSISACSKQIAIHPVKYRYYSNATQSSSLRDNKPSSALQQNPASPVIEVKKKKQKERTLALIVIKDKGASDEEGYTIRFEKRARAYFMEAPLLPSFEINHKKVESQLNFGYHRDYKAYAGVRVLVSF